MESLRMLRAALPGGYSPPTAPPHAVNATATTTKAEKNAALKFHLSRLDSLEWRWPLLACSIFLFALLVWSYVMALRTPPGFVPHTFRQRAKKSAALAIEACFEPLPVSPVLTQSSAIAGRRRGAYPNVPKELPASHIRVFPVQGDDTTQLVSRTETQGPEQEFFYNPRANSYTSLSNRYLNFCPSCATYKPPRAHHCSHCRLCVLKYDHHCPWIGQCVGFFNYKNFLLLLLYTWLLTGWVLVILIAAHVEFRRETRVLKAATGKVLTNAQIEEWAALGELNVGRPFFGVYVCAVESVVFFFMSSILLRRHIRLARRNLTTIDVVIEQSEESKRKEADDTLFSDEEREAEESRSASSRHLSHSDDGAWTPFSRLSRNNVYDLGVQRNLLQIFGDAKLSDRKGQPHQFFDSCSCYQEYLESQECEYVNPISRWLRRLLPFPAYPAQRVWEVGDTRSPILSPVGSGYGSTLPHRGAAESILREFAATEEHLLGLRFPTKASLGLTEV